MGFQKLFQVHDKTKTEEPECVDTEDETKNEGCNEVLEAPEPDPEVSRDSVMESMIAMSMFIILLSPIIIGTPRISTFSIISKKKFENYNQKVQF